MKNVMVLLTREAYVKEPGLTREAYYACCDSTFGTECWNLAHVPQEAYEVCYDIMTGKLTFIWRENAVKVLTDFIEQQKIDKVILLRGRGNYLFITDDVLYKLSKVLPFDTVMLYDNTRKILEERYKGDDWF